MRITCPNCNAQYEVDDAAIPEGGRDVQCSNCGHAWFQERPDQADPATEALYEPPAPGAAPSEALTQGEEDREATVEPPLPRRTLDDAVLAVLREEAEREAAARKAEAQAIEMQGDLGLPPPVSPAVGRAKDAVAEEAAPMSGAERHIASLKGQPVPAPKPAPRRDLFPDIEEINSTLKPGEAMVAPRGAGTIDASGSSGFRSGFMLMLILAVIVLVLYILAPKIAEQIPGLAPAMETYVATVDAIRAVLDGLIRRATGFLQGLSGG